MGNNGHKKSPLNGFPGVTFSHSLHHEYDEYTGVNSMYSLLERI